MRVLKALEAVEMYLDGATTEAKGSVDIARQIESQDVEIGGAPQLRRGVAKEYR